MNDQARFGFVGTVGSITSLTLTQINAVLGCVAAVMTIIYVGYGIRIRRRQLEAKPEAEKDKEE